ncbi:MAG: nucleotidyltransferase family protein [Planctomycetes bacterium]|nr:nucleotidyltransferase family protein [Planctomycetota bacterium]
MVVYEELLDRDLDWALQEGSMHFEKDSAVHRTLRRIAQRLDQLGIPYAIVGGMGMFFHGYRRFTEDVDILVTEDGLQRIHEELEGRGYLPPFTGSKHLRDTDTGVRIEFLVSGRYPGDGKPKPVAFPDPPSHAVELDGVSVLSLPRLVELKLASGMTAPGRLSDLGDVQKLISALSLPYEFGEQLDGSVREKFHELWQSVQNGPDEL